MNTTQTMTHEITYTLPVADIVYNTLHPGHDIIVVHTVSANDMEHAAQLAERFKSLCHHLYCATQPYEAIITEIEEFATGNKIVRITE